MTGRDIEVVDHADEGVFRSAMQKLERAMTHKEALDASVMAYRQRSTYAIDRIDNLSDDNCRSVEVRWVFAESEPYPNDWVLIFSDMLNNLRASLDHAVWELAVRDAGPSPRKASAIMFPVCTTASDFDEQRSRLVALSPTSVDRIRACQPFSNPPPEGLDMSSHPLVVLHHLNRLDKHRELHLVRRRLAAFNIEIDATLPGLERWTSQDDGLRPGLELGGIRFARPPFAVDLPVTPTIVHGEFLAATAHTPELMFGLVVEALCKFTIRAVAALDPRLDDST